MRPGSIEIQNVFQGTCVLLCQEVSIKNNVELVKNEIIQLEKQLRCKVHISSVANATCLVTFVKHDHEKYFKDLKEIAGELILLSMTVFYVYYSYVLYSDQ